MRKRKREKRPVLTSPWKIGTIVALMLIVTSFGVGYYMVRVYDIDLYWLGSDINRWGLDSYEFFREIYPAAAGIVLIALFTYFVIASAVRRYRYYLNSGQDYRKMISLADSIDDLTNPSQIARLSTFPELQDVLRNYGDQIREISAGMESREEDINSVDLEMEIDSILQGKGVNETLVEGKWWAPIACKIQNWKEKCDVGSDSLVKQSQGARQAAGQAALSCGKVIEIAAGAGEDVQDIVKSVGELSSVAGGLGSGSAECGPASTPTEAIASIQSVASALEKRGADIHGLSEENNGLALNIALMAARGEVGEKDLAQFAEKVRYAAEKFSKLGKELNDMARSLSDNCQTASMSKGGQQAPDSSAGIEAGGRISELADRIESRSRLLQEKMTSLGNDVDQIHRALQHGIEGSSASGEYKKSDVEDGCPFSQDNSIVNFGSESDDQDGIDDSGLVIDHGKLWEGAETSPGNDMADASDSDSEKETVSDDSGELHISGLQKAMGMNSKPIQDEQVDEEPPAAGIEEVPEETGESVEEVQAGEPQQEYEYIEELTSAPSQEQASIVPEKGPESADEAAEEVVEEEGEEMKMPADDPGPAPSEEIVTEIASGEETVSDADEEPVFDLFELGAVEYVEETEVQL